MDEPAVSRSIETTYKTGGDIRFVLLTSCQSGCDFCHLEGHRSPDEVGALNEALSGWKTADRLLPLFNRLGNPVTMEDVDYVVLIAKKFGLRKVQLTGGEPSLHPNASVIISRLAQGGMSVGMTTHGEVNTPYFESLLRAGLSGVNFSLHAVIPEQYVAMDLVAQEVRDRRGKERALRFAQAKLDKKMRNMRQAVRYAQEEDRRFSVKANTVVQDVRTAIAVVEWCNREGVDVRLQRDISCKEQSNTLIEEVVRMLEAVPAREDIAIGDSSGSGTDYTYPRGRFKLKTFGDIYVATMCDDCDFKDTSQCRERFYGIRVEHGKVTTCIDRVAAGITSFSILEFLDQLDKNTGVPTFISQQYADMHKTTDK